MTHFNKDSVKVLLISIILFQSKRNFLIVKVCSFLCFILFSFESTGESISEQHVRYVIGLCRSGQSERIGELTQDVICITSKGRPVKPKTIGQKQYG